MLKAQVSVAHNNHTTPFIRRNLHTLFYILFAFVLICTAHAGARAAETINVPAGSDLQAALDRARYGDTIILQAGATYTGPFTLPYKQAGAEGEWITIQSSALAALPANSRVAPANSVSMPKLVTPGHGEAALSTAAGAHHFRLVGLEFAPSNAQALVYDLIRFGDGSSAQNSYDQVPHHLVMDRCYVHALAEQSLKRGIALNSAATDITNSYISDFKAKGQDTQAIAGWNGQGPFRIVNNYLEGAGENLIFGGADPSIQGLVPSDIEISRNLMSKPLAWRGRWSVKNIFELKNARRVQVDGNILENCWTDAQIGIAVLFTVRNQDGNAPWSTVEDIEFTNNIVRHAGGGINILGSDDNYPSQRTARLRVSNNLFYDINGARFEGRGAWLQITGGPRDVTIEHNTALNSNHIIATDDEVTEGFVFQDNITMHNEYGVFGGNSSAGNATLNRNFPASIFRRNVLVGAQARLYPSENFFPQALAEVGFQNVGADDYRLAPSSAFAGLATDGNNVGCDIDRLNARQNGAPVTPQPSRISQLVSTALAAATSAATSTAAPASQVAALGDAIDAAYQAFMAERGKFAEADEIERRLVVANYFADAALALANAGAMSVSVQSRVQIAAGHLARVDEMMGGVAPVSINPNVKAIPTISLADARSSATFAPFVAPASAATVVLDRAVTTFGTRRVASSSRASVYELAGISVTVGGRAATLVDTASSRVGFVVPRGVAAGEAEVVVTAQSGAIGRGTVMVADVAPGIFVKSIGGVGLPLGKAGFSRGGFFRTTTMDASVTVATKLSISATGFSFAAPNTNLANDLRTATGTTPNLAESVAVEVRARDGRTWWLNVEFAGVSHAGTGVDRVTAILPPELRNVGTLELTLVVGAMRSNSAQLNFRQPLPQEEDEPASVKIAVRRK